MPSPALPALLLAVALAQPGAERWSQTIQEPHNPRPPALVGENSNAAGAYFRAWDSINFQDLRALGAACAEVQDVNALTPERLELLARHSRFVDDLIAAAGVPDCDWGVDYEAGWEMLLPYLPPCRQSARILRADALRCLREGSMIAAVERIRAMLRLSVHASENGVLISTMVGIAMGANAADTATTLLDAGKMTPAHARMLLAAFREVPRTDFYHAAEALENERTVTLRWLRQQCGGDDAGRDFGRLMDGMLMADASPIHPTFGLNEQQFMAHLDRADRYYQDLAKAWLLQDGGARLEELELELQEYQHGLIAVAMTPAMGRARKSVLTMKGRFDALERRLQELARPE